MTLPDSYSDEHDAADDAAAEPEVSKRSRGVALGLCLIGGWFGLHRFYVGKTQTAIAMIFTLGGLGIWALYDLVLIAAGEFRDADDAPLKQWGVDDPRGPRLSRGRPSERRVEELEDQLDALQQQFNDLAERVDFAERMLAQQRERPQLPRGREGER